MNFNIDDFLIKLSPKQQEIFNASLPTSLFSSIVAVTGRQTGKVQPNTTVVYSSTGAVDLGDIKVGDKIQSGWNRLTTVKAIYEHTNWDFYKITFHDGSYTYAGLEHLWYGYNQKKKQVVWDTKTIMEKLVAQSLTGRNEGVFYIPTSKLTYQDTDLPINPYLLGLLLGDGCITKEVGFTTKDTELVDYFVNEFGDDLYNHTDKRNGVIQLKLRGQSRLDIIDKLKSIGLYSSNSGNKFIPDVYKYASEEQRLELIRGLMDTDGYADVRGSLEFCSKSKQLRDDLQWLFKSIGIHTKAFDKLNKKYNTTYYYLRPATNKEIFRLERKIQRLTDTKRFELNRVVSIEYSHKADGRCITVDDENHTYVCDNNIMTHNTTLAVQLVAYYLLESDAVIGFFLPTYRQSKKVFKSLVSGLEDLKSWFKINHSDLTLVCNQTGSTVQFFTSENDNCRGFTFDVLIVDEACFVKDDIFTAAIKPTIAVATSKGHGKTILLSTPKTRNWFYTESITESDSKIVFRFTSEEGGQISTKVLNELRKTTPEHIFANEYLGEFLGSGNGLFKYADCILKGEPTDKVGVTAGLDFGVEDDYTVLTILNKAGELILIKRWNKVDWQDILDDVVKLLNQYGRPTVYCETNGIGNMPTKELGKKYNGTRTWNTSNKSKVDAINKLATDFHNKSIKIPNLEYLKNELDNFGTQTTKTGKLTYGASNGYHDDCVMSLAIANYHRHNGIRIQVNR